MKCYHEIYDLLHKKKWPAKNIWPPNDGNKFSYQNPQKVIKFKDCLIKDTITIFKFELLILLLQIM